MKNLKKLLSMILIAALLMANTGFAQEMLVADTADLAAIEEMLADSGLELTGEVIEEDGELTFVVESGEDQEEPAAEETAEELFVEEIPMEEVPVEEEVSEETESEELVPEEEVPAEEPEEEEEIIGEIVVDQMYSAPTYCEGCGQYGTFTAGPVYDENYHWYVCQNCWYSSPDEAHWSNCLSGDIDQCDVCEAATWSGEVITVTHEPDGETRVNDEAHWDVCKLCNMGFNEESHWVWCTDTNPDGCEGCGYEYASGYEIRHQELNYDKPFASEAGHGYLCADCGELGSDLYEHEAYCWEDPNRCAVCGWAVKDSYYRIHTVGEVESNDTHHFWHCEGCGMETNREEHFVSCSSTDKTTCEECGKQNVKCEVYHDFNNNNLYSNATHHWYVCASCGAKDIEWKHSAYCYDSKHCAECGYYSKNGFDDTFHDYDRYNFVKVTDKVHVVACIYCGEEMSNAHWVSCTNPDSKVCVDCGTACEVPEIWHGECEYEIFEGYHNERCKDCGEVAYTNEHWASCEEPTVCWSCGYDKLDLAQNKLTHDWVYSQKDGKVHIESCRKCDYKAEYQHYASCDNPGKCVECGYKGNIPLSHYTYNPQWDENEHWFDCYRCNATKVHKYSHWADCYDPDHCAACGAPASETKNMPVNHEYDKNGMCIFCDAELSGITSIIMPGKIILGVGEKATLDVQKNPADAQGTITYAVNNKNATFNKDTLLVTAKKAGTAVITATADSGATATTTVEILKAPSKVTLSNAKLTLGLGDSYALMATLSAGSASKLTWSSSGAAVTVDESGLLTAVQPGKATITVKTFNGKKATCAVTVAGAADNIELGAVPAMSVGQTVALDIKVMSGSTALVSEETTIRCEEEGAVEIDGTSVKLLKEGEVKITATAYNGYEEDFILTVQPAPDKLYLNEMGIIEEGITLGVGEKMNFVPVIANGSAFDIEFINENEAAATVSGDESKFTVTGKQAGENTTITVQPHLGQAAVIDVTVAKAPSKVTLSDKKLTLGKGETYTLNASFPADSHSNLTWKSSKPGIVAVDESGNLKAMAEKGSATITATTFNGKKATCTVTVKKAPTALTLTSSLADGVFAVGQTATLKIALSSGSAGGFWFDVDPASTGVVAFDGNTMIAEQEGEVKIIATAYNGVSDELTLTVQPAPDQAILDEEGATEAEITLGVGEKFTLKPATLNGSKADFSYEIVEGSTKTATISAAGLITAKKAGAMTIAVKPHMGEAAMVKVNVVAAPSSVSLSAKKLTLGEGETTQLIATLKKAGASSVLTWKSSKPGVVAVDENGNLKALKPGSSTITVNTFNKKKATCTVTVLAEPTAMDLTVATDVISMGQSLKLTPVFEPAKCANNVTYTLSEGGIVALDGANVIPVYPGTVTITASTYNGLSDSVTITVKEAPDMLVLAEDTIELGVGEKITLKPEAANGSPVTLKYKAKSTKVATVSADGLVTGKKAGKTTITVTPHAGDPVVVNVVVLAAPKSVSLSAKELNLNIGDEEVLTATLSAKSASKTLTWESSDEEVAQVVNGKVIAVGEGTATITVKTFNKKSAQCVVNVEGLPQAKNFTAVHTGNGDVEFSWDAVEDIDGYQLLLKKDGSWEVVKEVYGLSTELGGLEYGRYQFAVRAFATREDKLVYGKNAVAEVAVADPLCIYDLYPDAGNILPGESVNWIVEFDGGLEPYTFHFDLYLNGEHIECREKQTSNVFECTLNKEGYYTAAVTVEDGIGGSEKWVSDYGVNVANNIFWYHEEENGMMIDGAENVSGSLKLPAVLDGVPVAGISNYAFHGCEELTSVVIPEGMVFLGEGAFANCANLELVSIPESVTEFGPDVFDRSKVKLQLVPGSAAVDYAREWGLCYDAGDGYSLHIFSVDYEGDYGIGESGAWTVDAFGGSGNYKFGFILEHNGEAIVETDWIDDCEFAYTFENTGAYMLQAWVNDGENIYHRGCDYAVVISNYDDSGFRYADRGDGNLMLTGVNPEAVDENGVVTLPAKIDGIPVINVAEGVFGNCDFVNTVIIPEGYEVIESAAFVNSSIESVQLPGTLKRIEDYAFGNADGLEYISVPDSVDYLGQSAFEGCDNLVTAVIPASLGRIPEWAFAGCVNLETVEYSYSDDENADEAITVIGRSAFESCERLMSVGVGQAEIIEFYAFHGCCSLDDLYLESIVSIGEGAFECCCGLEMFEIGENLAEMGNGAFYNCHKLSSITLPGTLKNVPNDAFGNCGNLMEVTLEEGIETIGECTFMNAHNLRKLNLPSSLEFIGNWAFENTHSLGEIDFTKLNVEIGEGVFNNSGVTMIVIKDTPAYRYAVDNGINRVVIGETNTDGMIFDLHWEWNEEEGCDILAGARLVGYDWDIAGEPEGKLVIPASVEIDGEEYPVVRVEENTITDTWNLNEVVLPDTIKSIGQWAFANNHGLRKVTLPEGLEIIEWDVFNGCEKLEEVTVPASCTFLGGGAFANCPELKKVTILSRNADFDDGHLLDNSNKAVVYCYKNSTAEQFCKGEWGEGYPEFIPCTLIDGNEEFFGILDIEMYKYAGSIGENAIWEVYAAGHEGEREFRYMLSRNFEPYWTSGWMSEERFSWWFDEDGDYQLSVAMRIAGDADSETEFFADDEVLSISDRNDLSPFRYMFDGEGVRICGYDDDCSGHLDIPAELEVEVDGEIVTLPVVSIGASAFESRELTSVTIPESVETIMVRAFANSSLESVVIPDSVKVLDPMAFEACYGLISAKIGSGVSELTGGAFAQCTNLEEVILSEGLEIIGEGAFAECYSLKEIKLPESLDKIDHFAFAFSGLENIVIPNGVSEIGMEAFFENQNLESVQMGSGLCLMGDLAFMNCHNLRDIDLKNTKLEALGNGAFDSCHSLRTAKLPAGLKEINGWSFKDCHQLKAFEIPSSVKFIGDYAFEGCHNISGLFIPDSVEEFGEDVFCNNGSEIWVNLCSAAYYYVQAWGYNYVPMGEADLDRLCYEFMDEGVMITGYEGIVEGELEIPAEIDGQPVVLINNSAFQGHDRMTGITIPDSVNFIASWAFQGCQNLRSVKLPAGLEVIEEHAFMDCHNLTKVEIPNGTEVIGHNAFANCEKLEELHIPASVNDLPECLIENSLRCVLFVKPGSAAEAYAIENKLVYNNGIVSPFKVMEVRVEKWTDVVGDNAEWSAFVVGGKDGMQYNYRLYKDGRLYKNFGWKNESTVSFIFTDGGDYTMELAVRLANGETTAYTMGHETMIIGQEDEEGLFRYSFVGQNEIKITSVTNCEGEVVVPETIEGATVVGLADNCFGGRGELGGVVLPSTLRFIGDNAFNNCHGLGYVRFGENSQLEEIGAWAFAECHSLAEITLPAGMKTIGREAFVNCYGLESIVIPGGVTVIESSAFANCENLKNVVLSAGLKAIRDYAFANTGIEEINLQDTGLEVLGEGAFENCHNLRSNVILNSVVEMGDRAFAECYSLESAVIGGSLTEIPAFTFETCYNLQSVTLPAKLEAFGDACFRNCHNLSDIEIPTSVKFIGEYAFESTHSLGEVALDEDFDGFGEACFNDSGVCLVVKMNTPAYHHAQEWGLNYRLLGNVEVDKDPMIFELRDGEQEGWQYAVLVGYDGEPIGDFVIPSTYVDENGKSHPVAGIEGGALNSGSNIMSVTIPATVEYIADGAFVNCWRLHTVNFEAGSHLNAMGADVFNNCSNLRNINLDACTQLETIGGYAFANCPELSTLAIPGSVTGIDEGIVEGNPYILLLVEPDSEAERYAKDNGIAYDNGSGIALTVQDLVVETYAGIGETAEWRTRWIGGEGNVTFTYNLYRGDEPYMVPLVENSDNDRVEFTFTENGVYSMEVVITDETGATASKFAYDNIIVSELDEASGFHYAIDSEEYKSLLITGCEGLEGEVVIPSVLSIGGTDYAVNAIADFAFAGNHDITGIIVSEDIYGIGYESFADMGNLAYAQLPSTMYAVENRAFANCHKLNSVVIASAQYIGDEAFVNCHNLTEVQFPEYVESIGDHAFANCNSLNLSAIPESVRDIRSFAFENCQTLGMVSVSENVTELGEAIFIGCENICLKVITGSDIHNYAIEWGIPFEAEAMVEGEFAYSYNADHTGIVVQLYSGSDSEVIVPETFGDMPVVEIGNGAFENNSVLTSIDLPDSVEVIGVRAFANCTNLSRMI